MVVYIVFLFTSALFLSGYVLQQKTVNSLREAIKEPARPTHTYVYLPPQFADGQQPADQDTSTGNININPDALRDEQVLEAPIPVQAPVAGGGNIPQIKPGGRIIAVEVGSQIPLGGGNEQKSSAVEEDPARSLEGLSRAERRRRIKEDIAEATRKDREGYHRRTY